MKLREWKAMNAPKSNTTSAASTSTGYKKRFEKLIKYHIDHCSSELESILKKDIDEYGFHLKEHWNTGYSEYDKAIVVFVNKATDEFSISIYLNNKEVRDIKCKGYTDFVGAVEPYMFLPDSRTQEYAELLTEALTEWKVMNPQANTSQPVKTQKEKFTSLLYYIMKNKGMRVLDAKVIKLDNKGFTYREKCTSTIKNYTLDLVVAFPEGGSWQVSIYKNGKIMEVFHGDSWETLIEALVGYFNVPKVGTPEYIRLTEGLLEWRAMNPSQPAQANNTFDNTYRYKRLLAQIDADGISAYTVNELNDTTLDINVDTRLKTNFNLKIIYEPTTDTYTFQVHGVPHKGWDYEEDILPLLVSGEVISDTDLCESASSGMSLHEEFKEYETMWDTLDEWVDNTGKKVSINSSSNNTNNAPVTVYTWSIWTGEHPYERGRWAGAKFKNGVLEGEVFSTPEKAEERGKVILLGVPGPERFNIDVLSFSAVLTNKVNLIN